MYESNSVLTANAKLTINAMSKLELRTGSANCLWSLYYNICSSNVESRRSLSPQIIFATSNVSFLFSREIGG